MLTLYKYLSINDPECWPYRKELIEDRTIYFNDPLKFNDPLDCNVSGWEEAKEYLFNCRIFCMSTESRNDNLMFAHYADEHRGFRLKFITDNSLSIGESSVLALGREVIYLDDIPEYSPEKAHEYYYIKSKSWEYESEYRILLASDNIKTYFKGELVEVALGYRFDLTHLPKLKSWVANGCHQNVTFVKAVSSKSKISFEYIKIDV